MPGLGDSYWFVMFFLVFGTPFGGFGKIKQSRQTKHPQLRTCRIFCDWNWVTRNCCERHEYHEWLIFLFSRKVMGSLLPGSCFSSEQVSLSEYSWHECISTHQQTPFFYMYHFALINIPAFSFRNSCILKINLKIRDLKKIIRNCLSSWRFCWGGWGDLGFLWCRCTCRLWIFEKLLLRAACEVSDQVRWLLGWRDGIWGARVPKYPGWIPKGVQQ